MRVLVIGRALPRRHWREAGLSRGPAPAPRPLVPGITSRAAWAAIEFLDTEGKVIHVLAPAAESGR